jgi:hypothetical protein
MVRVLSIVCQEVKNSPSIWIYWEKLRSSLTIHEGFKLEYTKLKIMILLEAVMAFCWPQTMKVWYFAVFGWKPKHTFPSGTVPRDYINPLLKSLQSCWPFKWWSPATAIFA